MKPLPQKRWPEVFLSDPGATSASETVEDAAASTDFLTHPEERRWRKVEEHEDLGSILAKRDHVIPGIPGRGSEPLACWSGSESSGNAREQGLLMMPFMLGFRSTAYCWFEQLEVELWTEYSWLTILPRRAVFYVLSTDTSFAKRMLHGQWAPP